MSHHLETKIDQSYTPATKTWWDTSIHGRLSFVACRCEAIDRRLSREGDLDLVKRLVQEGKGVEKSKAPWNGNPETAKTPKRNYVW